MKTIAIIATHPEREEVLGKTLRTMLKQFDSVYVYLNKYKRVPPCLLGPSRSHVTCVMGSDIADNGKFYFFKYAKPGDVIFTLDDDISYPPDYVANTLAQLQIYPDHIITYHGRKLEGLGKDYYKDHKSFLYSGAVHVPEVIDVPGTACTAFKVTETFPDVKLYRTQHRKMSDLVFALSAAQHGKKIIVCPHDYGWLRSMKAEGGIHAEFHGKPTPTQDALADSIYMLNHKTI